MPWQLVYTSAARGLTPGQSGYCIVARSRDLREALVPRLEKLSYYPPGASEPVCAHRILNLRGVPFHILTRIVDAGLDFTRRRAFLAHHLIFDPSEISNAPSPARLFQHWNGWLNRWEGEPKWIETTPIASGDPGSNRFADVWVKSSPDFITALIDLDANWETTFTSFFQPGDDPEDFAIKAASSGADTVPLETLRPVEKVTSPTPQVEEIIVSSPEPVREPKHFPWPGLAAALVILLAIAGLIIRYRPAPRSTTAIVVSAPPTRPTLNSNLFPTMPTWLVIPNGNEAASGPIPEFHALIKRLRNSEIFTKDLPATIQTNLDRPPVVAQLDSKPEQNVLRFALTNGFAVDLFVAPGHATTARVRSSVTNNFAIAVDSSFRIVALSQPIHLPYDFLKVEKSVVSLEPMLEERLRKMVLPKTAQFALRPQLGTNDRFAALAPSMTLDLNEARSQFAEAISKSAKHLDDLQGEQSDLQAGKQKAITEFKEQDRLDALNLAIPKLQEDLAAQRACESAIPDDFRKVQRFSLLLCLSNVNTEIIRFDNDGGAR